VTCVDTAGPSAGASVSTGPVQSAGRPGVGRVGRGIRRPSALGFPRPLTPSRGSAISRWSGRCCASKTGSA